MRITHKLPQFSTQPALLAVISAHDAHLYIAHEGLIQRVSSCHITKPAYSDKEGFFAERVRMNGVARSGNVLHDVKKDVMLEFRRTAREQIERVARDYRFRDVYVFVTSEQEAFIRNIFSRLAPGHARIVLQGNFIHEHPFELLKKIQTAFRPPRYQPFTTEARRLLQNLRFVIHVFFG